MKKIIRAFTLVEVLLAMALFGMIAIMPSMLDSGIVYRLQAQEAVDQIGHQYRMAQMNARLSKNDSTWGVNISSNTVTLFKGDSYASRDPSYDIISPYDAKTVLSVIQGPADIIFSKVSGVPSDTITVQIQSDFGGTRRVLVNQAGGISYE